VSRPTTLYRFFDADGELLYVGITSVGGVRWSQHKSSKPWWPEIVTASLAHYETRTEAMAAESEAIRAEGPKHNRAGAVTAPIDPVPRSDEEINEQTRSWFVENGLTPIGVKQIAKMFGVHPSTVSTEWIRRSHLIAQPWRRFPEPTWPKGGRSFWATSVVESWGINTGRLAGPPTLEWAARMESSV
jgi:hypothetical protein